MKRAPLCNLYRTGWADAALQIHRKVRGWAASMVVHVTHDGTLAAVATTRPQSYSPPKGHDLVGTYVPARAQFLICYAHPGAALDFQLCSG